MRKRYHMMISDGMLTAARHAIKDSVLDPRGGGLNTFNVELRRVGGGGATWWGASWVMEETGLDTVSFQVFVSDIIGGLNMNWNTGAANVQIVTYVHEDEFPEFSPKQGFAAALADTTKKPWALERLPAPPQPEDLVAASLGRRVWEATKLAARRAWAGTKTFFGGGDAWRA